MLESSDLTKIAVQEAEKVHYVTYYDLESGLYKMKSTVRTEIYEDVIRLFGCNLLEMYRAVDFQVFVKNGQPLEKMETDFLLRVLNHIKVFKDGRLMVMFLDGTEIECRGEK